jgi:predicted GNAT superfamily acetyltransferase
MRIPGDVSGFASAQHAQTAVRNMTIRDATAADFPEVLALNHAFERFLSPLSPERLQHLHAQSAYHRVCVAGTAVEGFLLAFREGADYDSPNYRWFAARFARFLYVDRIVIAGEAQGRGIGSAFYSDLFGFARAGGVATVACEFDIDPPNETSARFHARLGFGEVGRQRLPGAKAVSLQVVSLD